MLLHHQPVLEHLPLGIRVRMMRLPESDVGTAASVSDWSAHQRRTNLCSGSACETTESPRSATGLEALRTGHTVPRISLPPPMRDVALRGTETPWSTPCLRVEDGGTNNAHALSVCSHGRSIAYEERYCELAAKRLAQEVLPFLDPPAQEKTA